MFGIKKSSLLGVVRKVGHGVKVAGPVLAGLGVAGPVGAAVTVAGQVAGAFTKKAGQEREATIPGSSPTQKISAPVASMSASAAVIALLKLFGVDLPQEAVEALLVLLPLVLHQIGHGAVNATEPRKAGR